jgi:single-strand DNA-binding protein
MKSCIFKKLINKLSHTMINKVILLGNVGKDPEVRHIANGAAVAQFSLATSETYKDKNGAKTTQTEWHNIVLWRGLAEIAEKYVKKGDQLYIEGKIRSRSYDDKDGNKRYITEIVGETMQMLGKKPTGEGGNSFAPDTKRLDNEPANESPLPADDLPF